MKRWVPAVAAVLVLTGCGGSAPARSAPTTPPIVGPATPASGAPASGAPAAGVPHTSWDVSALPDPCRTITNVEVAAVVGGAVKPGVALDSWPPLCQFVLDAQARTYVYISDDAGPTGREDYDRKRDTSSASEVVGGIGDQAYWQPDLSSLHVLGGVTHVFVAFGGLPPPPAAKDKAIALARVILPRTQT